MLPEFATVASITVICYLVGMTVRQTPLDNKWIPCIVGLCGVILGIIGWKVIPEYPANNILDAVGKKITAAEYEEITGEVYI